MADNGNQTVVTEVAMRIRELRDVEGYTTSEMAERTQLDEKQYREYESGMVDLPFTFVHKCALVFGVELTQLLEGRSARLTNYTVTRKGGGQVTAREQGIEIVNLAAEFRRKIAEPYRVRYEYSEELQDRPINLVRHPGHEFDYILSGALKVQVGSHTEILFEGDSIYYDSNTPHGMIAVGGDACTFCAVVLPGEAPTKETAMEPIFVRHHLETGLYNKYVDAEEDEHGSLQRISFKDADKFNFAFDVVDQLGMTKPDKLAMLHVDRDKKVRKLTFFDMMKMSSRAANYFKTLGIKRGDRVLLVLRRNYQFWPIIVALHKLGAIVVPATDQLLEKDFTYRFNAIDVTAIICTGESGAAEEAEKAFPESPTVQCKIIVNGSREGWRHYDSECPLYSSNFQRGEDAPCGDDVMLMFFTSGTTGYPKVASHSYKYALGHFITAKYWHCVDPNGLHFTISDTGWGKALWGKLYGQWLCEAAVFTYDFDRFDAKEILSLFSKFNITTFCAPPTMYRFMIKEDLSQFDLSSIKYATTAGEALNPEVFRQFKKATGLSVMEGFGQTETTLTVANLVGMAPKPGSMGRPSPLYEIALLDRDGAPTVKGEAGEICVRASGDLPCGLFSGYYREDEKTTEVWYDGYYHTGDMAWEDEDGYLWYVGRGDDLIKSSGYRIGPFEIESVIMELPYVLECAVSAAPDEIRGQIVKASVVLTKGTEGTEDLKKEIQNYVKEHTAPYKYPRIVVFREDLPKTISGKIQRFKL
ncbi:MAG: AMP-binding protein [Peptococcaceae bacterium]|jgi:acetyl-CoA synthetase|nr:AMP-binding protein [Peptococcaceae bacterium]